MEHSCLLLAAAITFVGLGGPTQRDAHLTVALKGRLGRPRGWLSGHTCPLVPLGLEAATRLELMNGYKLVHERPLEGQEDLDPAMNYIDKDDEFCGIFSSEALAEQARLQLVTQPGFRDYPNDFHVCEHEVDKMEWTEGFVTYSDEE